MTDEAAEACKRQGINPEDLTVKSLSDFTEMGCKTSTGMLNKSDSGMSSHHIIQQLKAGENNLAEVRFKHHEHRRRSKSAQHRSL